MTPEVYELFGADIFEHAPSHNRLIIKIVPKANESGNGTRENLTGGRFIDSSGSSSNSTTHLYNSNASMHSSSNNDRETVLFLGFEESWERDQWSDWLSEVRTNRTSLKLI